jgi:hypothetical protein
MARASKTAIAAVTAPVELPVQSIPSEAPELVNDLIQVNNRGGLPKYLENWQKTLELLAAPFNPNDVSFLPQTIDYKAKTAIAAAYADSRVYTQRMNEVIGQGFWRSSVVRVDIAPFTKVIKEKRDYTTKELISPQSEISAHKVGAVVQVGIFMGPILGWVCQDSTGAKDTADENWITTAEAQAYKRAMSKWGPGNYFYQFGKVSYGYSNNKWTQQPQIPAWAYPVKFCADCNQQIVGFAFTGPDNIVQSMSAWEVYERGMTKYGVGLCPECSKVRRDAATTAGASARLNQEQAA